MIGLGWSRPLGCWQECVQGRLCLDAARLRSQEADDVCGFAGDEAGERSADLAEREVGDVLGDGCVAREEYEDESSVGGADRRRERGAGDLGEGESNGRFSPDGKWVSFTAEDQIVLAAWDEATGKVARGSR